MARPLSPAHDPIVPSERPSAKTSVAGGGNGAVPATPTIRRRVVTVRVRTSGSASVRVSAQRRTCRRGRCAWKTKAVRSITTTPTGVALLRLAPGRYRLRVSAGNAFRSDKTITVRR